MSSRKSNNYWSIPRIWPGSTVFIIGGGPSLLKQDLSLIHDQRVIGINQAFKLGSWVDVCWYGDKGWYDNDGLPDIQDYRGLIMTCSQVNPRQQRGFIKYVGRGVRVGLETRRDTHVGWNSNSGASAVNVAYWFGASAVVLLGFDMQRSKRGEPTHWHDDYSPRIDKNGEYSNPYPKFMKCWPSIKKSADAIGLRIINATTGGALEIFERQTLEEVCENLNTQ